MSVCLSVRQSDRIGVALTDPRMTAASYQKLNRSGNEVVVINEDSKNPLAKIETISASQAVVTFAPDKVRNFFYY